jgi:hypothetical protein
MDIQITDLVIAFQRDYPREYEITALRLVNTAQAARIAELEAAAGEVVIGDELPAGR